MLATKMGILVMLILHEWRVGVHSEALILKFADMDKKRAFHAKQSALKVDKIYLDKDLIPAQVAHRKEQMPCILE